MSDGGATPASARAQVSDRLRRMYGELAEHPAAQYRDDWWTWAEMAVVEHGISSAAHQGAVPERAAIAVVVRQRPWCMAAVFGALARQRCAVLVTPIQSDAALVGDLRTSRPAMVVADPEDWDRPGVREVVAEIGAVGVEVSGSPRTADGDADAPHVAAGVVEELSRLGPGPHLEMSPDSAITVMTSGTTGPPKRLPVSWTSFVDMGGGARPRDPRPGIGAVVLSLPFATLGGVLSLSRTVFGGRPLSMMDRFDVRRWAALIKEHRPTVMGAPPPVVSMILDADIPADCFAGITAFTTASAPVDPDVAAAFEERYGIPVLQGYGATEFLASVSGWSAALHAEFGRAKLGSVGRPLAGVRIRIVDPDTGEELGTDAVGLVEVDPPKRASNLPEGWLRTADRGRIDADGFLWILGRADGVIIRGGFKVDLSKVERALADHPAVAAVCAVGIPDPRVGEVPAALVVLEAPTTRGPGDDDDPGSDGDRDPDEAALVAWARDRLAGYEVPAVIRFADRLPQTSTFKIHRAAVRELLRA